MAIYKKETEYDWEAQTMYEDIDKIRLVREADVSQQVRIVGWYNPEKDNAD